MKPVLKMVCLVAVMMLPILAWGASDGKLSQTLAENLYCSAKGLVEGNLGIIAGIILTFMGIWALIRTGKWAAAIPLIIMGALITALPSLVEAAFREMGYLLVKAEITEKKFEPPKCGGAPTETPTPEAVKPSSGSGTFQPTGTTQPNLRYTCTDGDTRSICL